MCTVTLIGNKQGVYIDHRNCNAYVDYTKAENFADINMENVNHLVICRDNNGIMRIAQASGYSYERGIFADLYA